MNEYSLFDHNCVRLRSGLEGVIIYNKALYSMIIKACMHVCILPTARRATHTGAHPINHLQHNCLHPDYCQTYCLHPEFLTRSCAHATHFVHYSKITFHSSTAQSPPVKLYAGTSAERCHCRVHVAFPPAFDCFPSTPASPSNIQVHAVASSQPPNTDDDH